MRKDVTRDAVGLRPWVWGCGESSRSAWKRCCWVVTAMDRATLDCEVVVMKAGKRCILSRDFLGSLPNGHFGIAVCWHITGDNHDRYCLDHSVTDLYTSVLDLSSSQQHHAVVTREPRSLATQDSDLGKRQTLKLPSAAGLPFSQVHIEPLYRSRQGATHPCTLTRIPQTMRPVQLSHVNTNELHRAGTTPRPPSRCVLCCWRLPSERYTHDLAKNKRLVR